MGITIQPTGSREFEATGAAEETHNNRLQRMVIDKVPRYLGQRAAAEPERYAA
jgi:hypothetical protein